MRWHGAALSAGTAISGANINTAGNGDTVTFQTSGTGTIVKAGDGFDITGAAAAVRRIDSAAFTAVDAVVTDVIYTPGEVPAATVGVIRVRSAAADVGQWVHYTDGKFGMQNSGGTVVAALTTPVALTVGHRYWIRTACKIGSSTGRAFRTVIDLDDPTWNTTGSHFAYADSLNLGSAQITSVRHGRNGGGLTTAASRFEKMGWDPRSSITASTTQATMEAEYTAFPYVTGAATPSTAFAVSADGVVSKVSGASLSVAFGVTADGVVGKSSGAAPDVALTVTAAGVRATVSGSVLGVAFGATAAGSYGAQSGASPALTWSAAAAGVVGKISGAAPSVAFGVSANGVISTPSSSGAIPNVDFPITASGQLDRVGGTTHTVTYGITAGGVRGTASGAALSGSWAVSASGTVNKSAGTTPDVGFGVVAGGVVGSAAGSQPSVGFGVVADGQVDTSGGVAVDVGFAVLASGQLTTVPRPRNLRIGAPFTVTAFNLGAPVAVTAFHIGYPHVQEVLS